jgi:bifunctional DNA-binding transcriptional regulator/antitoxin component of YhaV-PrlF toxin-antitoxin module
MQNSITIDTEGFFMATLTVTSRGQVTFRKEVLQHLGVKPGDKIELQLLPGSKGVLQAERKTRSISELAEFLKGKTNGARLTIEEINDAIAEAASAEVMESFNR